MANLTVVLNHVAGLRQIMRSNNPEPLAAAVIAQLAGADGIAVHLREDRKHIQEQDLRLLRRTVRSKLILHIAPTSEMIGMALDIKPERVVLEPEIQEEEPPFEDGLDLVLHGKNLFETVDTLQANGIGVGVNITADPEQAKMAHQIGADWVQISAGKLRTATSPESQGQELDRVIDTVKMAQKLRLRISIGHGMNAQLLKLFKGIPEIDEFSMGESLIAQALLKGMERAVRDTIDLIRTL